MNQYLSLKDHVYNYISGKINDGSLKPEEKISEQQIADALGISRTPIREALIQLASDGYLENMPRRGFRVKLLDVNKAKELYEIIGVLDGRIAYMTVDLITEGHLKNMRFIADSMQFAIEQGMNTKYYELQGEFHDVYTNLCKNKEMVLLINDLKKNFLRKYYVFEKDYDETSVLIETNKQHYEIIKLFEEKNKEELEKFIRDIHWEDEMAIFNSL